jgi:lipid II isoglutaminyl synthase (glutamine-hydrolysing)
MVDTSGTPRLPARGSASRGAPTRAHGPAGVRRPAAVGIARIAARIVGVARHQGTALPGMAAERVWPGAFAALADQLRSTVLIVGTNGKTTTSGLIAEIVRRADGRPIANRSGANMRQGIVSSLVSAADLHGRLRRQHDGPRDAVFEVDEMALEQLLPELGPSVIVATNLFRDQLDRYGEADSIADRWAIALATAAEGSILVHCADDPRLVMLASGSPLATLTFGLAGPPADRDHHPDAGGSVADPVACRTCGRQLVYTWRSIGHLGDFACPEGHVRRVAPDVTVESIPVAAGPPAAPSGSRATLRLGGRLGSATARPALPGLTNAYNVAAAVTAGAALGHELQESAEAIEGYEGPFGRLEWLEIEGRNLVMVLIKNTVSLAETVFLAPTLGADVVLLGLNDAPADGRDVSWIWDAPIAPLVADRAVVLTGSRAADLHLRLLYDQDVAAAPPRSIEATDSLAAGLDAAVARTPLGGTVIAAGTYTAMMGLRSIAQRRGDAPPAPR